MILGGADDADVGVYYFSTIDSNLAAAAAGGAGAE